MENKYLGHIQDMIANTYADIVVIILSFTYIYIYIYIHKTYSQLDHNLDMLKNDTIWRVTLSIRQSNILSFENIFHIQVYFSTWQKLYNQISQTTLILSLSFLYLLLN